MKGKKQIEITLDMRDIDEFKEIINKVTSLSEDHKELLCGMADMGATILNKLMTLGQKGEKLDAWIKKNYKKLEKLIKNKKDKEEIDKLNKKIKLKTIKLVAIEAKMEGYHRSLEMLIELLNYHLDSANVEINMEDDLNEEE